MQTTGVVLTGTPQAINVPDTGARIQSIGGLYFKWLAALTQQELFYLVVFAPRKLLVDFYQMARRNLTERRS